MERRQCLNILRSSVKRRKTWLQTEYESDKFTDSVMFLMPRFENVSWWRQLHFEVYTCPTDWLFSANDENELLKSFAQSGSSLFSLWSHRQGNLLLNVMKKGFKLVKMAFQLLTALHAASVHVIMKPVTMRRNMKNGGHVRHASGSILVVLKRWSYWWWWFLCTALVTSELSLLSGWTDF